MAPPVSNDSCGSSAAASDVWHQWPGYTIECKATFLHIVDAVEARLRLERLPRSKSSPAALKGPRPEPAQEGTQRNYRTQYRRHLRIAAKKRRRGEAVAVTAGPLL